MPCQLTIAGCLLLVLNLAWCPPPPTPPPRRQALKRKGCGPGSSSERTRTAITGALKKKLKDLMGEFQDLRWVLLLLRAAFKPRCFRLLSD